MMSETPEQQRARLDNEDAEYINWCKKNELDLNQRREDADGWWDEFWKDKEERRRFRRTVGNIDDFRAMDAYEKRMGL